MDFHLDTLSNSDITASGGMRKIKKWLISARVMFGSAADTLESHLEEICNYFTNRTTSGARTPLSPDVKSATRQWRYRGNQHKNQINYPSKLWI
jgi:transposase